MIGKTFIKTINDFSFQCFKKIRSKKPVKVDDEILELMEERRILKVSKKDSDAQKLRNIEDILAEKVGESNFRKIQEDMKEISHEEGKNKGKIWKMKRKLCPKIRDPVIAKIDKKT